VPVAFLGSQGDSRGVEAATTLAASGEGKGGMMGVDYYVICPERKDVFGLGRIGGHDLMSLLRSPAAQKSKDIFAQGFLAEWLFRYDDDNYIEEHILSVGRTLWLWCVERDWKVSLVNDAMDEMEWRDWPETGEIDHPEPDIYEMMSPSQRRERDAMMDDREAVLGVVSDLRRYRVASAALLGKIDDPGAESCDRAEAFGEFARVVRAIEAGE
jgi:hypothetical protein